MLVRKQLLNELTAVSFEHGFITHLDGGNDVVHNTHWALIRCNDGTGGQQKDGKKKFLEFLKPIQALDNICRVVNADTDGVGAVLQDCANKFKLFRGHQFRCHVQHTLFQQLYNKMLEAVPETNIIITMDYKIKFEQKTFRQNLSDWHGWKGMSWHGIVVTYRLKENGEGTNGNEDERSENVRATKNLYLDHVCRNDPNQTAFSVASIVELVCRLVFNELSAMKTVVLRSDSATKYNNNLLPVIAPFMFRQYGIELRCIVHSEIQDG